MNLKTRLLLFTVTIFSVFILITWFYSESVNSKINEEWAVTFVRKQIAFDRYRTILPIIHEVAIVKELALEPSVIAMAKHEKKPKNFSDGIKTLEEYRIKFQDRSYFAAFSASGNYYYNDGNGEFDNKQLRYTLSPKHSKDAWFYKTIEMAEDYQVNVDKDRTLGVTKVWINYILRDQNKAIGIIGTGFNFDKFVQDSVGLDQKGIQNFFIDKRLAIQLAKDTKMIDYASITKKDGAHKTIDSIITDSADIVALKNIMTKLEDSKNVEDVETLWTNINGEKHLVGIAYQPEIGWFCLTIFDNHELAFMNDENLFLSILILFSLVMIALFFTFKKSVADLRLSESKFRAIFNYTNDSIMLLDENGFIDCNRATLEMFNCASVEEFCMYHPADLSPQTQPCGTASLSLASMHIKKAMQNGYNHFEWVHRRAQSNEVFFADVLLSAVNIDESVILQAVVRDESERKKSEEEIQSLAFYDTLTQLPNRRLLSDRMKQAQMISKRNQSYCAILFMDLDNFKPLNDEYGHTIGDLLLQEVAQRIKSCVRGSDTIARFGGDEFIVLLRDLDQEYENANQQALLIAQKIHTSLADPYRLQASSEIHKNEITVTHDCGSSIGYTLFVGDTRVQDEILHEADSAMYEAKKSGRNRICKFNGN